MLTTLKRILKMCGHALTITVHERLDAMEQRSAETDNAVLQASIRMAERIPQVAAYAVVNTATGQVHQQWIRLILNLYSSVPSRKAAIAGTPSSGLVEALRAGGYETLSYEPSAALPDDLGVLVAVSSEGIAQSMNGPRPAVFITEVGDTFAGLTGEMRSCGYHWYLVVQDGGANGGGSFYANEPVRVPGAAGHAFFFSNRETFVEAQSWCAALLRRTYFRFRTGEPEVG